jgi:hypothetical protein
MGIPFFLYAHSHNFYLDVALEQGLFGLLAVVLIMGGSGWILVKQAHLHKGNNVFQLLTGAAMTSLLVILLHGFVDDALYGGLGMPLLFAIPGFGLALGRTLQKGEEGEKDLARAGGNNRPDSKPWSRWPAGRLGLVVGLLGFLTLWRRPLVASWYANLGAVEMARVELTGFPTGKWDDGENVTALETAVDYFGRTLQFNPANRTAQHRLGLIALLKGEFQTAISHLERAYLQTPGHRGIRKALGYSYAWSGNQQLAARLLEELPETRGELRVYVGWWKQHNRVDLSNQAKQISAFMEGASQ